MTVRAYLGIGANVGDPRSNMRASLVALDASATTSVVAASRLYRTPPWGKTDQPFFLNACAAVDTTLAPRALLDLCLSTERGLKRERGERWGPRTIDLDVLDYAGQPFEDGTLTLPHPRMQDRAFVLVPLRDIAPDFRVGGLTLVERLASLDRTGIEAASADGTWWRDPEPA